jgi:hypothetical protein
LEPHHLVSVSKSAEQADGFLSAAPENRISFPGKRYLFDSEEPANPFALFTHSRTERILTPWFSISCALFEKDRAKNYGISLASALVAKTLGVGRAESKDPVSCWRCCCKALKFQLVKSC